MLAVGFDIGATKIASAIVNKDGRIITKSKYSTPRSANDLISLMAIEVEKLLRDSRLRIADIIGVGIGAPGPVDYLKQEVIAFTNLPIPGFKVGHEISSRLKIPTFLDNDGNTAAIGEYLWGVTKNCDHSVVLTLGTGVGSGIIEAGNVLRGFRGSAAEIGHMVIEANGPDCGCGNRGCLEALVAGPAILRTALKDKIGIMRSSLFKITSGDNSKITTELVTEQALIGDKYCLNVFKEVGYFLGIGFANVMNILNPEIIAVGGGVGAAAGDLLIALAADEAFSRALPANSEGVKLLRTQLGNDVGVMGAAGLAFKELQ